MISVISFANDDSKSRPSESKEWEVEQKMRNFLLRGMPPWLVNAPDYDRARYVPYLHTEIIGWGWRAALWSLV